MRIAEFEEAGVDLLLLQCSPQLEEMERFAAEVIRKRTVSEIPAKSFAFGHESPDNSGHLPDKKREKGIRSKSSSNAHSPI
jgi:hypothetical protein